MVAKSQSHVWAVVPAAGAGRRMGAATPKQYLTLCGATVLEHTLRALLAERRISAIVVSVSSEDEYFDSLAVSHDPRVLRVTGGAERSDSVRNALQLLETRGSRDDLVVVHDAARPCLSSTDLKSVIEAARNDAVGAVLAVPMRDTVKRADGQGRIETTVSRENLWRAQTPQVFRLGALLDALLVSHRDKAGVTDEAQAMERCGAYARLVSGDERNIKLTVSADIAVIERFLQDLSSSES